MLKGYVISDIHFGASSNKDLYDSLKKVFLSKLKKLESENDIDIVVICGDLLDHKLSLNSEASKYVIQFMNTLSELAIKKKFMIRVIKGTKNHDLDQLNNFLYLEKKPKLDFRIINVCTAEDIVKNDKTYKILYVPEEYMENPKEFYKDFFSKTYNIAFVHGTFNHVEFASKEITSEKAVSTAPIFSYSEFDKMVTGPVLCGHIHEASSYKKKIYYTGSFARWCFGEEKDKGYMSFIINDDETYQVKFIKNKYAKSYLTVNISDIDNITDSTSLEAKINEIQQYKKDNNIDHLRLNVSQSIYDKIDNNIMKKYFSQEDNGVKISLSKEKIEREKDEDNEMEKTYGFIFNNEYGLDVSGVSKTISKYLKIKDNITLNDKVIEKELLTEE